jgi:outer membrane cobalamin receptor
VNPGYAVIGAGAAFDAARWVTVFARVSNAANRDYESVLGYPAQPRAFAIGARVRVAK